MLFQPSRVTHCLFERVAIDIVEHPMRANEDFTALLLGAAAEAVDVPCDLYLLT
ncbi:MAG TPA: hypothetical protein VK961_26820 [Chthoniobacter sp.]|nr:hypothetical protein [Chthoniobacter sp.]